MGRYLTHTRANKHITRCKYTLYVLFSKAVYFPDWFQVGSPYLSHTRTVQAAITQQETLKTSSTVPGHMVIRVFITKRVSKLILFRAPILCDEASVKSLPAHTRPTHQIGGSPLCSWPPPPPALLCSYEKIKLLLLYYYLLSVYRFYVIHELFHSGG